MSDTVLSTHRRRRDHHAQPSRRHERAEHRDQGGAARRGAEAAADDAVRAVVLTGAGRAFCVGQDLGARRAARRRRPGAAVSTVARALQPDRHRARRDAEAGGRRGERRRGRARGRVSPSPATSGSWPTPPRSTPGLRGRRADRRLRRLVDAAAADRPRPRRRPAALPAPVGADGGVRARAWSTGSCRPRSSPPRRRRWPARLAAGPDRRLRRDQGALALRGLPQPRRRPWTRRASCRPRRAPPRTTAPRWTPSWPSGSRFHGPLTRAAPSVAARTAAGQVVVDHAGGLHQRVGRGGADEAEAAASSAPWPSPWTRVIAGTSANVAGPVAWRRRARTTRAARPARRRQLERPPGRWRSWPRSWRGCARCRRRRAAARRRPSPNRDDRAGRSRRRRPGTPRACAGS